MSFAFLFRKKIQLYFQLMRVDKPIGTLLLLWPTLTALFLAGQGQVSSFYLFIFLFGAFLVRSGGCVVNDIVDRSFDGQVTRTKERPLVTGRVVLKEAVLLSGVLFFLAFILVLFLNRYSVFLAILAGGATIVYPFMKRVTMLPQVWLGLTFNSGILIAFSALTNHLSVLAWLLYVAAILMTIAYDTFYAMVDREDDLKVGVKSTAILFGKQDKNMIFLMTFFAFLLLVFLGFLAKRNAWYFSGLFFAALIAFYQQQNQSEKYFQSFLNYNYVWFFIFLGTYLSFH